MSPPNTDRDPGARRVSMRVVHDSDTDDRWTSAVLLSYCGLLLVVGVATLYALG